MTASKTSSTLFGTKSTVFLWMLFGFLLSIVLFLSLNKEFSYDEVESVHTSWKILQGERLYVDFFQHHHPLLYYLIAPIVLVVGENTTALVVARIAVFSLLVLILAITYQLSVKVFSRDTGIISVILLTTTLIFTTRAIEIRPDVPQTLFSLTSLLCLFSYLENKSKDIKYLILSAVASGVAFLFLQKALVLTFLVVGLLLFNIYRKTIRFRDSLIYLLVFSLSFLPYVIYLIYSNTIDTYFTFNWILNIKFLDRSYPFNTFLNSCKTNFSVWFFYVLGLFYFLRTSTQKQFGLLSLGLLVFIFLARKEYEQYFMPVIPLVAIASSYTISQIFNNKFDGNKIILLVLILSVLIPLHDLTQLVSAHKSNFQLQKINYVLSITSLEDFVYDGNVSFNVFRKDIDFFWYSLDQGDGLSTYQSMFEYNYDVYKLIDQHKPRLISNHLIKNMNDERIVKNYKQSNIYQDLFIRMDSN